MDVVMLQKVLLSQALMSHLWAIITAFFEKSNLTFVSIPHYSFKNLDCIYEELSISRMLAGYSRWVSGVSSVTVQLGWNFAT